MRISNKIIFNIYPFFQAFLIAQTQDNYQDYISVSLNKNKIFSFLSCVFFNVNVLLKIFFFFEIFVSFDSIYSQTKLIFRIILTKNTYKKIYFNFNQKKACKTNLKMYPIDKKYFACLKFFSKMTRCDNFFNNNVIATIKVNSRKIFPIKNFSKINVFIKILDVGKNATNFMCLKNKNLLFFINHFLNKEFSLCYLELFSDFIQRIMEENGIISVKMQFNSNMDYIFFINSLQKKCR